MRQAHRCSSYDTPMLFDKKPEDRRRRDQQQNREQRQAKLPPRQAAEARDENAFLVGDAVFTGASLRF